MKYKDYIILIPSRLGSTRLKYKPLVKINGKRHAVVALELGVVEVVVLVGLEVVLPAAVPRAGRNGEVDVQP